MPVCISSFPYLLLLQYSSTNLSILNIYSSSVQVLMNFLDLHYDFIAGILQSACKCSSTCSSAHLQSMAQFLRWSKVEGKHMQIWLLQIIPSFVMRYRIPTPRWESFKIFLSGCRSVFTVSNHTILARYHHFPGLK